MIRDPSDGSVKEINPAPNEIKPLATETLSKGIISGLPFGSTKPDKIARLEKSREWLREYRNKGE